MVRGPDQLLAITIRSSLAFAEVLISLKAMEGFGIRWSYFGDETHCYLGMLPAGYPLQNFSRSYQTVPPLLWLHGTHHE